MAVKVTTKTPDAEKTHDIRCEDIGFNVPFISTTTGRSYVRLKPYTGLPISLRKSVMVINDEGLICFWDSHIYITVTYPKDTTFELKAVSNITL